MLKARVTRLEQRLREHASTAPLVDLDDAAAAAKLAQFTADLSIAFYTTWRHEGLSLEQKLALARDDARRESGAPWPARAARELEIRALWRDRKIDEQQAWDLRANAEQHYFPRGDR